MAHRKSKSTKKKQVKKKKVKKTRAPFVIEPGFWKRNWLPGLIIFLLPFLFYLRTVDYGYVLDDQIVIRDNDFTKKGLDGIWDILTTESMQGYFGEQKDLVTGARYRPLSIVTFAIEYEFFGADTWVHHFVNIVFYALTCLLLFRVLAIMLPAVNTNWYLSIAFVATLLFVLHPIHVEAVANIKGRDEIMTLLGALGTLYFSFRYIASNKVGWLLASGITFFLGLLAKENALTFLAIVPLSVFYFTKSSWKKIFLVTLPLIVIAAVYLFMRYNIIGYLLNTEKVITDIINNPFYGMAEDERLATVFYTLGIYLKLLFLPHPLTHDYYPYHIPIMDWTKLGSLISLLIYVGLGIYALWGLRKKSIISYGIFFFIITLSIVSNLFFSVGTFMNDRFIFISSIGFCIILAYFISRKLPELVGENANILNVGLLGLFVLFFAYKTWTRVPAWESALTLNSAAITVSENSARANCFMGTALFEEYKVETDAQRRKELLEQVSFYIDRSLSIYPDYFSALTMKSGVSAEEYKMDGDLDKLLNDFFSIIEKRKFLPFIEEYLKYLNGRVGSGIVDGTKMSNFYHNVAIEHFVKKLQDFGYAKYYLELGLEANPNDGQLLYDLSTVYQGLGDSENAKYYLQKAKQVNPSFGG